jgi:hypothetical protein
MSTLKSINVIHPSATVNNLVNDASGNVTVGNDLYVPTGNVGIGTASPANKFEVYGNSVRNVARASTTAGQVLVEAQASDYWSGPTYTGTSLTQNGSTATGTNAGLSNAGLGVLTFQNCTAGLILTNGATPIVFATTAIERMRIDSSGNVGINTPSPTAPLNTYAGLNALSIQYVATNQNGGSGVAAIGFNVSASSETSAACAKAGIGLVRGAAFGGGSLCFYNNNSGAAGNFTTADEKMRIDSSGNVGIGTSSPLGRFQVVGSAISNPVASVFSTASGDTAYQATLISKYDNDTTTSQVFIRFAVNNNGATSGQINANGANSAAFGTWSDERLKDNIVNLPSQLANICALRPVEFDYKDGSGHQIGFVAQEMKTVYPDAVGTGTDDMLTLTGWSKTEARLVAAIQELEARLAKLETVQ